VISHHAERIQTDKPSMILAKGALFQHQPSANHNNHISFLQQPTDNKGRNNTAGDPLTEIQIPNSVPAQMNRSLYRFHTSQ